MGNEESVINAPRLKTMNVPTPAAASHHRNPPSPLASIPQEKIRTTHLQCKWSQIYPNSFTPPQRTDSFSAYIEARDIAVCGYGKNTNGELLNDIWAYSFSDNAWTNMNLQPYRAPPRVGAKAVFADNKIFIFGGENNGTYLSDFHYFDLASMRLLKLETSNEGPCGRVGHVMETYDKKICIWGGFNEKQLDDLWIYDIDTNEWTEIESNIPGRSYAASCVKDNLLYITCASKIDDIIIYDFNSETIDSYTVTGSPPAFDLKGASLSTVGRYLILIGGFIEKQKYAMVRAFDTVKKWWFVFYIIPDDETTTIADGGVDTNGIFLVPRMYGGFSVYRPKTRQICMSLGMPMNDPPPVWIFNVGDGVSVMHQQLDLLDMLHGRV